MNQHKIPCQKCGKKVPPLKLHIIHECIKDQALLDAGNLDGIQIGKFIGNYCTECARQYAKERSK